jgi:DNA polymerase alpha subunit B
LCDPDRILQEDTVVVGRIVRDFKEYSEKEPDSKLTEDNITIEGSRQYAYGQRVPIRFAPNVHVREGTGAQKFGLIRGGIAAFKGKNGGGGSFQVSEILTVRIRFDSKKSEDTNRHPSASTLATISVS